MYTHHYPSKTEQTSFRDLYHDVEKKYPFFQQMKKSRLTMICWFLTVVGFFAVAIDLIPEPTNVVSALLCVIMGLFGLQLFFIAAHTKSHALFLEYDKMNLTYDGHNDVLCQRPVFFYAFYHHHHTFKDNWMPELSYYDREKQFVLDHDGTRNVIAAHWHGFSLLSSRTIVIPIMFYLLSPITIFYFLGFEIGVVLLPFAHGWQHIPRERFGYLRPLFVMFEHIGLFASSQVHDNHHVHTGPTVYKDFSSSGIYFEFIEKFVNQFWDRIFYQSQKSETRVHANIKQYAHVVYFLLIGIAPFIIGVIYILV